MPGTSAKRVAHQISRLGRVALGHAHPELGGEHQLGGVAEHAVHARQRAAERGQPPRFALARVLDGPVQAVGHQHQPARVELPAMTACSRISAPASCPTTSGLGPEHVVGEAAHHLGEPVDRVGVARAILGVAVQRQVGDHEPVALGETLDHRLPLAVGQQPGVQQRKRRSGADLAVGDARAVGVVVEAKPHRGCVAHGHDSHRMEDRRHRHMGGASCGTPAYVAATWSAPAGVWARRPARRAPARASDIPGCSELAGLASELVKAQQSCA